MSVYTQISHRAGRIDRVKLGETPVIELNLEPLQYVVNVTLTERPDYSGERKTRDWMWTAFVVTPLPDPEAGAR